MQYRKFGTTGFEVSALGFGAMRLPTVEGGKDVDEPLAVEMIRYAIDHGVNYVDTAWPYHGGQSERVLGRALRDGYRRKVRVATKLPPWEVRSVEDCERILTEQLKRLETDRIDFYLLHCINRTFWERLREAGALDWIDRPLADGRIGAVGFSYHDDGEFFRQVVDARDWAMCQIQYNLVGEDVQAGTAGLKYAAQRGLAVVIMEPLFGGVLADPPEAVRALWDQAGRDPVDTALQWLWDKPQVACVLSGMSTMEQVVRNVASAERSAVGGLSSEDRALVARVQAAYRKFSPIPCTKCRYCMPCPHGVDIPRNFELYNDGAVFGGRAKNLCHNLYVQMPEPARAAACTACGECEEKCPQNIPICQWLPKVESALNPPRQPEADAKTKD